MVYANTAKTAANILIIMPDKTVRTNKLGLGWPMLFNWMKAVKMVIKKRKALANNNILESI